MKLQGNKNLSKWFMVFMFMVAIFLGEILPVWLQGLEGTSANDPGAKQSMFASWSMFIPTVVIYGLLAVLFWWLYRRLHWLYVILIAAALGVLMEFTFMRPEETSGPNVVENPWGALVFFIIIWPLLVVVPYGIFNLGQKLLLKVRNK